MKKILIIQAPFYRHISQKLLEGATAEISRAGFEYQILDVLGALEIAPAIAMACKSREFAGFVALGCVIRGETSHYDIVAQESARALVELATHKKLAIGNGIITVENEAQALTRADKSQKNKGGFAAQACLEMIKIRERFRYKKESDDEDDIVRS